MKKGFVSLMARNFNDLMIGGKEGTSMFSSTQPSSQGHVGFFLKNEGFILLFCHKFVKKKLLSILSKDK